MANESLLTKRVAFYIRRAYPKIPFRVDIAADMPLPPRLRGRLGEIHGAKWTKGHPDLFLMSCRGGYGGLYLELKDVAKVPNTEHTRIQAEYHKHLRKQGYRVAFSCGYEQSIDFIDEYMKLNKNKKVK